MTGFIDVPALERAFRQLRHAWFLNHLKSYAHERDGGSQQEDEAREESNRKYKAVFDQQTDGLIRGHELPVSPQCLNDLYPRLRVDDID